MKPAAGSVLGVAHGERRAVSRLSRGGAADEHLVCVVAPHTFEAERYRMLAHSLEHRGLKRLGVTSPVVGDGKTTTAVNLAVALGESGRGGVLLVDADLRRPSVGRSLGLGEEAGPGLAELLADPQLELDELLLAGPTRRLSVLRAGGATARSYEMLQSPRFSAVLDHGSERFRWVVVDTPPLLLVPDARVMAGALDGYLVVVSAHRTPRRLLGEALDQLDAGKVAGLVLNRDDASPSRRYRSYYADYARRVPVSLEAERERH